MIALVFLVIAASTFKGSSPYVSSSISTNLGLALTIRAEFAVEIKVKDGTIIVSFGFIPTEIKAACKADVPELKLIQNLQPT